MKKNIFLVLGLLVFFGLLPENAAAFPDLSGIGQAVQNATDKTICISAKPKITQGMMKIHHACSNLQTHFGRAKVRLETVVREAGEKGYDINSINNDYITFEQYTSTMEANCRYALGILRPMNDYSCENSDSQENLAYMKAQMRAARGYVNQARFYAMRSKLLFRQSIRPHVDTLKHQQYRNE